jgi:hypothetical protein
VDVRFPAAEKYKKAAEARVKREVRTAEQILESFRSRYGEEAFAELMLQLQEQQEQEKENA